MGVVAKAGNVHLITARCTTMAEALQAVPLSHGLTGGAGQ